MQLTFHPWDKYQRTWPQRPLPSSIVTVEVSNNHALGRGSVRLDAADPQKPPLVAGPYLRHAQDGKVLAWAMRELRGIMSLLGGTAKPDSSTAAHSHTGAGWGNGSATVTELLPGADLQTDEELIEYARTDTHYLLYIFDQIRLDLAKQNKDKVNKIQQKINSYNF